MHDPFTFTDAAGVALSAHRWSPPTRPLAAVELVHGMGEHIGRYQHVVDALNNAGFVVFGYDQRGHGASIGAAEPGYVGASGWPSLVSDIGEFARHIREREDGLPLGLVAHSMGSFASQQALLSDSERFDAIALTGTAALDLLEPALDLEAPLDLAMFNAGFAPPRTDYDWLSRDASVVDAYIADPLCGFGLDVEGARDVRRCQGAVGSGRARGRPQGSSHLSRRRRQGPGERGTGTVRTIGGTLPRCRVHRCHCHRVPRRPPRSAERDQPRRGDRRSGRLAAGTDPSKTSAPPTGSTTTRSSMTRTSRRSSTIASPDDRSRT